MRVRVLFHDNCFDGAASAALFTRFYLQRVDSGARLAYRGMAHQPGEVFVEGSFDGDENAVVDFRYSPDERLTWWFDHHVSAFIRPEDEAVFRARSAAPGGGRQFFDPTAKSCARFLARTVEERFGFDPKPTAELIHWAEIVDGAMFESPQAAVRLAEPALQLMTWIENNKEKPLTERFIGELAAARPLGELAAEPWIRAGLDPVLAKHERAVEIMRARTRVDGPVVSFDVIDDGLESANKFIPYFLHPEARFVVGLSANAQRVKVSVGTNPWKPRPPVNIAAICERYGGGGHPVVGAISVGDRNAQRAREIAGEVIEELKKVPL